MRVYQTRKAGDAVNVIDPATNKVVQSIKDIEVPHGVAFSPDGTRAWITCEAEKNVWVVDTKTGRVVRKIGLSGDPNNLAVSKDGKRVFIGIRVAPGAVDVIDTASLTNIKSIPVKGAIHNVYVTPDGKYTLAGSGRREDADRDRRVEFTDRVGAAFRFWRAAYGVWRRRRMDRQAGSSCSFPDSMVSRLLILRRVKRWRG